MSKYIKELVALDTQINLDKKLLKKIFENKTAYYTFISSNVEWILEKSLYDYQKDELHVFMLYLQKNAQNIVQGKKDAP